MASRYWVGGSGNWDASATANWASSSGGASGASAPTFADDVFFDSASHTGNYTVTTTANVFFQNLTMAAPATGKVTLAGGNNLAIYGNLNLSGGTAGITWSHSGLLTFNASSGTQTVTMNGITLTGNISFNGTATRSLLDALLTTGSMFHVQGTVTTNNNNVTCAVWSSANTNPRTLNMGSSTFEVTSTGTVWDNSTSTNLTVSGGTSTIKITDTSATDKTFHGGGKTFYNIWFTGSGTGKLIINGTSTSFNEFRVDTAPKTVHFTTGISINVQDIKAVGTPGNLITFNSTTGIAGWGLGKASGAAINCNYLHITWCNTLGLAPFYAGRNSTNGGNNTGSSGSIGWQFTAAEYSVTKSLKYTVTAEATPITKSLQYGVAIEHSITKTLYYAVSPSIPVTKSLQYRVTGQASVTKQLKYTVVTEQTAIQKDIEYQVSKYSYSRQYIDPLPGNDARLATAYTEQDYIDVATDDTDFVGVTSENAGYVIHEFSYQHSNNTDSIAVEWKGKTDYDCSTESVFLEVYNRNTGLWESIDSDSSTPGGTEFTLTAIVTGTMTDYFDSRNVISCRVYQLSRTPA